MNVPTLRQAGRRFLFEPCSPLPVCGYRIVLGSLLFADGLLLLPDARALFGDSGVLPLEQAHLVTRGLRLDLFDLLPSGAGWLGLFFSIYLAATVCLAVGLFTRVASIAVYVGLTSLHHRNGLILNSADDLLRVMAFWMMFAPAGEALSLDARRAGRGLPRDQAPWALRMMQLQVSIAYLASACWKLDGPHWRDGTALYYVTRILEFRRLPVPYLFEHLWTLRLLTWSVVAGELALGTLIWVPRLRPAVLIAGLALHLGIEWSMLLPLMQWVMIGTYLLFLPPRSFEWLSRHLRSGPGVDTDVSSLGRVWKFFGRMSTADPVFRAQPEDVVAAGAPGRD